MREGVNNEDSRQNECAEKEKKSWQKDWQLHLMILPGLLFILIFKYMPLGELLLLSRNFARKRNLGSPWVGLENFEYMLALPDY